ncbi:NB-ARC domain-containing protein [Nostoc parmelioides]|uniref:NACHT domain-containing protein n=1 Tax=Nostoc parmelioides FACHB-3921 TaxID=2692909 RepID=A0ABR8BNY0_9NOSO|nr:NB-ARC domain-containing protein [Nostoc parmelioides]MBD2255812.1 NACHT domain-containing protein [Nostoc parmelioides FACHB-3921]
MPIVNSSGQLTLEQALAMVNELMLAKMGRHLSDPETTLLEGTWNNDDYQTIAEGTSYTANYLKGFVAPRLWNIIAAIVGTGKKVTKTNLRSFLEYLYQKEYSNCSDGGVSEDYSAIERLKINGEPPDVSIFFGRSQELSHIKDLTNDYKLLSLIGIAGVGKTALAAKFLNQISSSCNAQFERLIWKSVAHAPTVQELVNDLIQVVQDTESPSTLLEYTQVNITSLLQALQSRRCLIVLDGIDTFQTTNFEQRLDYRLFFRRLIEEQHQSFFIVTSRALPLDFKTLSRAKRPLQYIKIKGLDSESAMKLLLANGLTGNKKCRELIEMYYGHPAELQSVVERINYYFAGSTEAFFHNKTTFISPEMQSVLDEIFSQELNEAEHRIMLCLASCTTDNQTLVSFNKLLNNFPPILNKEISISELIESLECLENLSLIDTFRDPQSKELYLCLQPVIKKYIFIKFLGITTTSEDLQTISLAS